MTKKKLVIFISCVSAVETATNTILGVVLPEDKKALVIGIATAVFGCIDTILALLVKTLPEQK